MKLDELYNLYFQDIYRFLVSLSRDPYTAEDLVQETFYRAYVYLENYKSGNVKSWLFTVARNVFIDHYRKQRREVVTEQSFFTRVFDRKLAIEDQILISEEVDYLLKLLGEIPPEQRMAIILRDFHDFSYEEASEIMEVSLANFKVLLYRGRQRIRKRRNEQDD